MLKTKNGGKKVLKKDQQKSEEEEHPNDDHVYMTEEDDIEKIERELKFGKWTLKITYFKKFILMV